MFRYVFICIVAWCGEEEEEEIGEEIERSLAGSGESYSVWLKNRLKRGRERVRSREREKLER